MAFDVSAWLKDDLGFSEDDAKDLAGKLAAKSDVLEKGYLRQADYSRQMNAFQKAQADLKTANDKLNRDIAEWGELTAAEKAEASGLRDRIEKADAALFQAQQKLTRLAEETGRDPKEFLGETTPVKPPEPKRPDADLEGVRQQLGGLGDYMLTLNADLPAIAQEHYELTGERLDTRAFIAGIKADLKAGRTENLDPIKRWESQFGIPKKRDEKRDAAIADRVKQAREEGLAAGRSEALLPNAGSPVGRSDSSSAAFRGLGPSKLGRPNPSDHLSSARAALAEGRYRNAGPGGVMPPGQR